MLDNPKIQENTGEADLDLSASQNTELNLVGRIMRPTHEEYDCKIVEMTPTVAFISSNAKPAIGERVIAYVEHVGRIEGVVTRAMNLSFYISVSASERKREKLSAQLTWLTKRHHMGAPEDRRHERIEPRNALSELTLQDGRKYSCRIIDLSLSGAAISINVRPALGTDVELGKMHGRIVRHFQEGIAIEFSSLQV